MENGFYVVYVGISNIEPNEIEEYVRRVTKAIIPPDLDGNVVVIPVNTENTRIECINPKYITNDDLVKQNTMLLFELNYELQKQIKLIKNEEN